MRMNILFGIQTKLCPFEDSNLRKTIYVNNFQEKTEIDIINAFSHMYEWCEPNDTQACIPWVSFHILATKIG